MDEKCSETGKPFCCDERRQQQTKKTLLLHYAGDNVFEIHSTLADTGNENDYAGSKTALENYFKPQLNTEF